MPSRPDERNALEALRAPLRQGRARARTDLLLRAVLRGAVVGATTWLLLGLLGFWWAPPGAPWSWAALTFALSTAAWGGLALSRTPSLLELARRADHRFELRERVSTALEAAARVGERDPLERTLYAALLSDAGRQAERIDPRALVPLRVPRTGWWLTLLLAGVLTLQLLPPLGGGDTPLRLTAPQLGGADPVPLTSETRAELGDELRRTAALIRVEGDERKDAYLQALARAFDELSREVELGEVDTADALGELGRLMEHVERALGEPVADGGGSASPDAATPDTAGSSPPGQAQELPEALTSQQLPDEARRGDSTAELDRLRGDLAEVEASLEQAAGEREARRAQLGTPQQASGGYADPATFEEYNRERAERLAQQGEAGGVPIGAAQESTRGEGDFAGEGVQPLEGPEDGAAFDALVGTPDEVLLPEGAATGGERIEREVTPETRAGDVAARDAAPPELQASEETGQRRELLGPSERLVASRYFEVPDERSNP